MKPQTAKVRGFSDPPVYWELVGRLMGTSRRRKKGLRIAPIVLIVCALAALAISLTGAWGLVIPPDRLTGGMLARLLRVLVYLSVGLLIGQVVESLGWTARLARLVRPLTRWGRLKPESGAAFVSGFISGIVSNTMLMGFYQDGKIERKELILTYLVNNGAPIFLVHLPTTFFIVVSLAGEAGLVYIAISAAAALLRSAFALALSRAVLTHSDASGTVVIEGESAPTPLSKSVWSKFRERFPRIVLYTVPIYILVFVVNEWGVFDFLKKFTAEHVPGDFFPVEKAGVIVFSLAAEFSSGMAAAGALLDAGTLTVKQTAVALIVGTVLSTPIRAVRHQLPTHSGIFTPGLALELLTLSQCLRALSLILITAIYVVRF